MDEAKKKGVSIADIIGPVSKMDIGNQGRPQLEYIDIDLIDPDPRNRKVEGIPALAQNIALVGLQQPLAVRANPDAAGRYVVISGHRRREALKQLVDEGEERFRLVPCLVAPPGMSDAMVRLMILSGNMVTQGLTPAQMAAATKEMEDAIYQLKEEGHEFPGKVRDYVADACGIAGSRVTRLKVIRENLIPVYMDLWENSDIGESAAYVLSRFPAEFQERLYKALSNLPNHVATADRMERVLKKQAEGWDWSPCLTCPDGKECKRGDTFLRRDCVAMGYEQLCGGKTCCLECGRAKEEYGPCEQMCSKAKAVRKDKKDKAKEAEEERRAAQQRKYQDITQKNAQRLLKAIDKAGLENGVKIPWTDYSSFSVNEIRQLAAGNFIENPCRYDAELTAKSCHNPAKVAKLLGVSTDWLLGVTEDFIPGHGVSDSIPVSAPDVQDIPPAGNGDPGKWVYLEWLPPHQKPDDGGLVALKFDLDNGEEYVAVGRCLHGKWCTRVGTPAARKITGWFPLPWTKENEEDPEE